MYFVKRPGHGRVSFAIQERLPGGKYRTVRCEEIKAINRAVKTGAMVSADADFQVKALCDRLNDEARKSRGGYVASEANRKLLNQYWDDVYEQKKITAKDSAWNRLRAAVDTLGPTSVLGPRADVQTAIDNATRGRPRAQRRHAAAVNQIRRRYGIADSLHLEPTSDPEFRYLRSDEFARAMEHVDCKPARLLFSVLFHTGLRTGEAFFLRLEHYKAPALNVQGQVDRRGVRRATKTRKVRKTICFPAGDKDLRAWLALTDSERQAVGLRTSLARTLRRACKKAFPKDRAKWVAVHDLRHSFAVHCLVEKNFRMGIVAKLLGNSEYVCEKYYANFVFEDDTLAAVVGKL
jgi:integrase